MAKILDLDSIVPPRKELKLAGKIYPIVEMSVGLFAEIKRFESADIENQPIAAQVGAYADLVKQIVPSLTDKELNKLTIIQLQKIFSFALNMAEEVNEASAGEEAK